MAPTRSKKRKSNESTASSVDMQGFPVPPQMIPTKSRSPVRTPTRSPIKKARMGITFAQKQALIDNLQLEITERARKLRAQYMLQAQGIRSRIEIRVNRIPMALRKANMGELLQKYNDTTTKSAQRSPQRAQVTKSPSKDRVRDIQEQSRVSPSPQRPRQKRPSDEISLDKENEDIENPKKRLRGGPAPPTRTVSRGQVKPSQVLSPRSANSQTLPRSPIRPTILPTKSALARPVSPLKPRAPLPSGGAAGILTNMVEKAKGTRGAATKRATETKTASASAAGVGRGRRAAAPAPAPKVGRGRASTISDLSDSSNTTVIRKPVAKKEPAKRTVMSTLKGMGGASKKAPTARPATAMSGTRVLRKRN
ncbi:Borealin N terminal-domain-containing protein [Tricladium varicosporioides]|nr:Borealin N terminal-domain-containing protein [Hymenoscyphus varicosporioides]